PLQAVVDTTGTVIGLQPNFNGLGLAAVSPPYQGPLHVIGAVSSGPSSANLDFAFKPFPYTATIGYGDDNAGKHTSYAHPHHGAVDLNAAVQLADGAGHTSLNARVDRLPQALSLDYADRGANSGAVDLAAKQNGRLPDVGVDVTRTPTTG